MNGLERMDQPRRWPLILGLGMMAVIVAGLAGWYYYQRPCVREVVSEPSGTPVVVPAPVVENAIAPVSPVVSHPTTDLVVGATSSNHPDLSDQSALVAKPDAAALAAEADTLLAAGKKELAREKYLEALAASPDNALRAALEEKSGKLNAEMIRLPWPMVEKQDYVVQTNDAIKNIARKFGTTVEMIVKGNELKRPDIIRPGQRLKVFTGKLEIVVSKSRHDLLVTANGRFFKRYRVATGRYEKTPVGAFIIVERIPEPPWHRDDGKVIPFGDKENILGSRWMAIKATGTTPEIRGYGIHGTTDNASIGKSESAGCIRLKNEDVEELFEMVPLGTPVVIQD